MTMGPFLHEITIKLYKNIMWETLPQEMVLKFYENYNKSHTC